MVVLAQLHWECVQPKLYRPRLLNPKVRAPDWMQRNLLELDFRYCKCGNIPDDAVIVLAHENSSVGYKIRLFDFGKKGINTFIIYEKNRIEKEGKSNEHEIEDLEILMRIHISSIYL